ncbi:MAG TPA: cysteine desulfurase family protein [Candidatus Bipolaricaulota bacterium]|nr:cysteine desulfurase family protein [Candidatus Bipolaricaulota bacterium]
MNRIYFDNAATTKVDPQVLEAMLPFFTEKFGNPSSIHSFGQEAEAALTEAREKIADILGCQPKEAIFTSGATESNNLAILGVYESFKDKKPHFITSAIEHPAVLETFKELKNRGCEVDIIGVDHEGMIKLDELKAKIKKDTALVSIMYANNEIGVVWPIEEIAKIVAEAREKRTDKDLPIYLHTDAAQAFNYLPCKVNYLGCDLLTISGQKIFGPKGVGLLFIRNNTKISPITFGGHQEGGLRPGTINVALNVGLAKAMEMAEKNRAANVKKVKSLQDKLAEEILKIKDTKINGSLEHRLPNNLNISFKGAEGESILMLLDMEGIAVSTGSACSSGSLSSSHVLTAMGIKPEWSHGSLRITLGRFNTEVEVRQFLKVLPGIIEKLRQMSPK